MIISIINFKGGVGKTPFAFSIAKDLKLDLLSNDYSSIENIYDRAKIEREPQLQDNCVYDFGGFVDKNITHILAKSDFVIVPCKPNNNSILQTLKTLEEVSTDNENIIVLNTDFKTDKQKKLVKETLSSEFENLKFFNFKHSTILDNSIDYGLSFKELLKSYSSYKNFVAEYKNLLKYIKIDK